MNYLVFINTILCTYPCAYSKASMEQSHDQDHRHTHWDVLVRSVWQATVQEYLLKRLSLLQPRWRCFNPHVMRLLHAWLCDCLWVSCYFWWLLMLFLKLLILCILRPTCPPPHCFCQSLSSHFYEPHPTITVFLPTFCRKRHHSCDSEEDQRLTHQAKRAERTPSLLVSDLDSEVIAFISSHPQILLMKDFRDSQCSAANPPPPLIVSMLWCWV